MLTKTEYAITFPDREEIMDQDEEYAMVVINGDKKKKKIRLHDYSRLYKEPGLYEEIVYDKLKCQSPEVVTDLLKQNIIKDDGENEKIRALDFGAGNGIVGECLKEKMECETLIGVDIIHEAKMASRRDRPEIYDNYYVMDFNRIDDTKSEEIKEFNFNLLITVAALGFGDIQTKAFINAYSHIDDEAWVAFNIRDKFLQKGDKSGFKKTIERIMHEDFNIMEKKKYRHRYSITGNPIYYYAVIGKKIKA
jgi:predicted TPR repeat methyltransferase